MIYLFIILFIIFTPIELKFRLHKSKIIRCGWFTDLSHFFINHTINNVFVIMFGAILYILLGWSINPNIHTLVSQAPTWVQFLLGIIIADIVAYWYHRLSHEVPFLWKFHAIHHSSEHLDWLAAFRIHPIGHALGTVLIMAPLVILGFKKELFASYVIIAGLIAVFVHANVNLKITFLNRIIATPQFHHWHHSTESDAINKNYAAQFPILDIIFGTYYLPLSTFPKQYGCSDKIFNNYFKQIIYPFIKRLRSNQQ